MTFERLENSERVEDQPTVLGVPPLWRLVSKQASAIAAFNTVGSGFAFYCVHPISGDVTSFSDLARSLGPEQVFYGIQVPERQMKAAFAASVTAVAQHHVQAVIAAQPEGPLVLGGWSVGAVIALEMAQQLRALGRDIPLLIAMDGAPANTGAGLRRWGPAYSWKLICNLPGWLKYEVRQTGSVRAFARLAYSKVVFRAQIKLPRIRSEQTLSGDAVQQVLDKPGWKSNQVAFIRALYEAVRAYVPEPYGGRVIVYESKTQPIDHLLQVGAAWRKIAPDTEIVRLDGNHVSAFREPSVSVMASHLRHRLGELGRGNE